MTTSCVLETVSHYREKTAEPFLVLHDEASYMVRDRHLWDALTKPEILPRASRIRFPLDVQETRAVNSAEYIQVQFADVIAGATAAFVSSRQNRARETPYFKALQNAGVLSLTSGGIWPSDEVTPEELGSEGFSNKEMFEEIGELLRKHR